MASCPSLPAQQSSSAATDDGATKKQYAELVKTYSERVKETHVFSGEHYRPLAQFLEQAPPAHGWRTYSGQDTGFFPLYVHVNKPGAEKTQIFAYDTSHDVRSTATNLASPSDTQASQLMILRGWQPRDWVRTLGAQCKVDPEFFRRHLDFLEPASYFDLPALPSTSQNLWRLRVTTICNRVNPLSAEEVRKQRKDDLEGVNKFLNALRASERIGSSIVRRHAIINETTCVIEQDISFCVQKRRSGGWTGFIWLDNGKPFDDNSIAPWLENYKAKFSSHNPYLPIVQHLDKMALNPPNSEVFDMSQIPRSTSAQSRNTFHASQTLSNLPEQYGMSLNRKLMKMDALYAFSDLFNVALCSENQFLNMIQAEINVAIRSFHGQEENCIDILSYCKGLIDEHYDRLREMVALLENEENNGWPRVTEGPEFWTRDDIAKALRKDVQHLLYRCSTLAERAIDGTNFIRNYAMLLTSERSISQAKEVGRLTLLAYFFLPMSLVTSLFGMNFVEIEDWRKAVISAVAVFAGVMTISLIICI